MEKADKIYALVVEDDLDIRELIKSEMTNLGISVVSASNGKMAIDLIKENRFDIFVLDRMLPELSGLEICKYIRNHPLYKEQPILLVTALTMPKQIIEGLESGADDYICKPFDINVLMARIKSCIRRLNKLNVKKEDPTVLHFGSFELNYATRRFLLEGKEVALTKSEFTLLGLLIENIGRVMDRSQLKKALQGDDTYVTNRTIDTHIFGLRKKLRHYSAQVESVRGIGYRINENV